MLITLSEEIAIKWLMKTRGYLKENIKRNAGASPDFICTDGNRYEIKLMYDNGCLSFTPKQIKYLRPSDIIIIVKDNEVIDSFDWGNISKTKYILSNSIYFEKKLYIKQQESLDKLNDIIKDFKTGDNLVKSIIILYETGMLRPIKTNRDR